MGYLYTWDQIRSGHVPSSRDFMHMQEIVGEAIQQPCFLAACLFGSIPRGDFTARSDVDMVAVCRSRDLEAAKQTIVELDRQARQRHLRLNAHLHTCTQAKEGEHPFNSSHRHTMRDLYERGCSKGALHELYRTPGHRIRPDMIAKLGLVLAQTTQQAQQFERAMRNGAFDEWILESWERNRRPMRLYLCFTRWAMWWHRKEPFPDGKHEVVQAFLADPVMHPYHEDVAHLQSLDVRYDDLLIRVQEGGSRPGRYRRRVTALMRESLTRSVQLLSRAIGLLGTQLDFSRIAA